ncbi:MAG: hypothetical protein AAGG68_09235 [Bacteroidota bacterium]
MSKGKKTDFQAITDLVAIHALTQIAWQNSQEEEILAEHQSDSQVFGAAGRHQSDANFPSAYKKETNPITFAWRLMKLLRGFFEGRQTK